MLNDTMGIQSENPDSIKFCSPNKMTVHILHCLYINFRRIADFTILCPGQAFSSVKFYGFIHVYPF